MPTKDKDQAREQARARQARFKAKRGNARPVTPDPAVTPSISKVRATRSSNARAGNALKVTPSPVVLQNAPGAVRCWHCGAHHATVQLARDCKLETAEGRVCATYGMSATAPDRKTLVDVAAIAKSLSAGKLEVRFGCFGPTFEEIARELARG